MIKTKLIRNNKDLPKFIRQHEIFEKFKSIKKIFPSIGLDNCKINVAKFLAKCPEGLRTDLINDSIAYDAFKDCQLVFSSDNRIGMWDIATMSMRGN